MNGNDPYSSIPEDAINLLEEEGRRLEAIDVTIGTPSFMVITYQVDLGDRPSFKTPPSAIKFSKKEYAITNSTHIKLGSSRYYREYEGNTSGVGDSEEARLVQRGSLSEFLEKSGVSPEPGFEHVSTKVTWATTDFLMFCASVISEGRGLEDLLSEFPDYDCATIIPDPSAFAMQLGKEVGRQFDRENVRLNGVDRIKQMMLPPVEITTQGCVIRKRLDTVIQVSHGPVIYCDPPEDIINRFPLGVRGAVVPFVKRAEFAGQREYRFVLNIIGEPEEAELLMEITDELRSLCYPRPERKQVRNSQ